MSSIRLLPRDTNQVRGLAQYALDFLAGRFPGPSDAVVRRLERFHVDSVGGGVSALALGANAPTVLRREAFEYPIAEGQAATRAGACCFGSRTRVQPEKAVLANSSAVREWDANGTNFGFDPARGHIAGEFGHNDFYPVAVAAAAQAGLDGRGLLDAMLLIDEIRGRLAEVFSLKSYKIDHVLHGAIAAAVVYGAVLGASVDEIESAVGLVVAHHVPFRAIRHGKQLSDSKGASAALAAETAVVAARRALRGFVGPADVFRNPEAPFCLFQRPNRPGESPFDLVLGIAGDDFCILGMHFKLGLYEHQSAGAIQGLFDLLAAHPELSADESQIRRISITIYEPAFGIIGDPAKHDPRTRQSADHSMPYIIGTLLRKALERRTSGWDALMLLPEDYDDAALVHPVTRRLMRKIDFRHGGPTYDARYPDGIPTMLEIEHAALGTQSSGLVMYPEGHARHAGTNLDRLLRLKFERLTAAAVDDSSDLYRRCTDLADKSVAEVAQLYAFPIRGVTDC